MSGRESAPPDSGTAWEDHRVLKSLLGAWALAACSAEESAAVEAHLLRCAPCADEAHRLREAVGLLHPEDNLDLDPTLRSRVLESCLDRRAPRVPVPEWATPYDAETSRLDALLRDMAEDEWRAPVRLRWFDARGSGRGRVEERETSVARVIGHLLAVDGIVAAALGLPDPLGPPAEAGGPVARTEAYWRTLAREPGPREVRDLWREQARAAVRTASFAASEGPDEAAETAERPVSYGGYTLPLRDAFLDRAFECWTHAADIADAVAYPYDPPSSAHLARLVDLAARQLPATIAVRRREGLAAPPRLAPADAPGRTLHLEVEGSGGGDWYIPLDSPRAAVSHHEHVAHVALDGLEFCQLAAGHVQPEDAAAGQDGDREAIRDVLFAAASLSRL